MNIASCHVNVGKNLTFTVDSDGSFCILTNVKELPDNRVIWCAPVHKEQIVMLKPRLCETPGIVHLLVKSDDSCYVMIPEVWNVGLRSMQGVP